MELIANDEVLQQVRDVGKGYIYNDYVGNGANGRQVNILHAANCSTLGTADTKKPKYRADDVQGIIDWLIDNRPMNWKICGTCKLCPSVTRQLTL